MSQHGRRWKRHQYGVMGIFARIREPNTVGVAADPVPFCPPACLSLLDAILGVSLISRRNWELFMVHAPAVTLKDRNGLDDQYARLKSLGTLNSISQAIKK